MCVSETSKRTQLTIVKVNTHMDEHTADCNLYKTNLKQHWWKMTINGMFLNTSVNPITLLKHDTLITCELQFAAQNN